MTVYTSKSVRTQGIPHTHASTPHTVTDDSFGCRWKGPCPAAWSSQCDRRLARSHGALFPGRVPVLLGARSACCAPQKGRLAPVTAQLHPLPPAAGFNQ